MNTEQKNQIVVKVQLDLLPSNQYCHTLSFVAKTIVDPLNGEKYIESVKCLEWAEKNDGHCEIPKFMSGDPKDFKNWICSFFPYATKITLIETGSLN